MIASNAVKANPWLVRPRRKVAAAGSAAGAAGSSEPRLRLICFPYAGGGSSVYRTWPAELPAEVEVIAVELPGRDTRFKDRPVDRLAPLVEAVVDGIGEEIAGAPGGAGGAGGAGGQVRPFAIYGHSMGALIGFAVARELRRRKLAGPRHLFVSGRRAPQLPKKHFLHALPEAELMEGLRKLGGISEAVLRERELMDIFLPILRADFAVAETSVGPAVPDEREGEAPLACGITALGGRTDDRASLEELEGWAVQTRGGFELELFEGGHFFHQQQERGAFFGSLSRRLAAIVAAL